MTVKYVVIKSVMSPSFPHGHQRGAEVFGPFEDDAEGLGVEKAEAYREKRFPLQKRLDLDLIVTINELEVPGELD